MVHKAERPSHSLQVKGIVDRKHLQLLVVSGAQFLLISLMSRNCAVELGITIHPGIKTTDLWVITKYTLWSDFLMNHKITLDFGAMILKTVNCNIPLMSLEVNNDAILLHVEEDTYISNQEVKCQA